MKHRVVIFSPNPYSRYTLSTLYLLEKENIEVSAVVCLKLFNIKRFFSEFSRDGTRLLKKIYRKLILKSSENKFFGKDNIVSYMKENGMDFMHLRKYCKKKGILFFTSNSLNNERVIELLDDFKPGCIVFTGGGLLRKSIIRRSGKGIINCHMGILPFYRGMDVVQWPILNQDFSNIGLTTHIIDEGVDTGDILEVHKINPFKYKDLNSLRNHFEKLMPQALVSACIGLLKGSIKPSKQDHQDGIQHFIINERLEPFVDEILANNFNKFRTNS